MYLDGPGWLYKFIRYLGLLRALAGGPLDFAVWPMLAQHKLFSKYIWNHINIYSNIKVIKIMHHGPTDMRTSTKAWWTAICNAWAWQQSRVDAPSAPSPWLCNCGPRWGGQTWAIVGHRGPWVLGGQRHPETILKPMELALQAAKCDINWEVSMDFKSCMIICLILFNYVYMFYSCNNM